LGKFQQTKSIWVSYYRFIQIWATSNSFHSSNSFIQIWVNYNTTASLNFEFN